MIIVYRDISRSSSTTFIRNKLSELNRRPLLPCLCDGRGYPPTHEVRSVLPRPSYETSPLSRVRIFRCGPFCAIVRHIGVVDVCFAELTCGPFLIIIRYPFARDIAAVVRGAWARFFSFWPCEPLTPHIN